MSQAPGPRGHYLHGSVDEFRADPMTFLRESAERHGEFVRFRLGLQECFLVSAPRLLQQILVAPTFADKRPAPRMAGVHRRSVARVEGDDHRRRRRLLEAAFRPELIEARGAVVPRLTEAALAGWQDGQVRPLFAVLKPVVLGSLLHVLLGEEGDDRRTAIEAALAPIEAWLSNADIEEARFRGGEEALRRVLLDAAAARRAAAPAGPPDLLQCLLAGVDSGALDADVLVDEIAMMLMTDIPVTVALVWTFYHLIVASDVHARLAEHLAGQPAGAAVDPAQRGYLDQVVREALRLHPPVWTLAREARATWQGCPYSIPAGSEVLLSPYVLQSSPLYWERPDEFLPERFDSSSPLHRPRPRLAYFPFGAGIRKCIGERLTMSLMRRVVATLVRRARLELPAGYQASPTGKQVLRPQGNLPVAMTSIAL